MKKQEKILSRFLLAIYLLVVAHQSVAHNHILDLHGNAAPQSSHQHEDFRDIHHEHQFHIGIFHFLGHLLESISQTSDTTHDHLVVVAQHPGKKVIDYKQLFGKYFLTNEGGYLRYFATSSPDPPLFHSTFLQKLIRSTRLLRAPPSFV